MYIFFKSWPMSPNGYPTTLGPLIDSHSPSTQHSQMESKSIG